MVLSGTVFAFAGLATFSGLATGAGALLMTGEAVDVSLFIGQLEWGDFGKWVSTNPVPAIALGALGSRLGTWQASASAQASFWGSLGTCLALGVCAGFFTGILRVLGLLA